MELYLESPFNVDVDIMPLSEVEKIFRAFAEKRKAELPRFTPDGIPITLENKFDDAIYHYLYEYWKTNSGEYDPKKDVIPESEMNKMHPKTKNEFQFEKWLFEQYGMTKKEERGYTLKGNLESLWEIFSAADMVLFARGLPSIGKELAQLGKKAVDDVAGEAIEKTVKKEAAEEMAESTTKKEMADTVEDLSQKITSKEDSNVIREGNNNAETELFLPDEYYENLNKKIQYGYQEPNTREVYRRLGNTSHDVETSVVISDEFGRIKYRIDYSTHGNDIAHTNPHIHEFMGNVTKGDYHIREIRYFIDETTGIMRPGRANNDGTYNWLD